MPTTVRITAILSSTIAALNPALSLIPITSMTVMAAVMKIGGQVEPGLDDLAVGQGHCLEEELALCRR